MFVYEYSGTTYQMIKDALDNENKIKEIPWKHKKEIQINNLAEMLNLLKK